MLVAWVSHTHKNAQAHEDCAAKKLKKLPVVRPPTSDNDIKLPAASSSSGSTHSAKPIMQLLPK